MPNSTATVRRRNRGFVTTYGGGGDAGPGPGRGGARGRGERRDPCRASAKRSAGGDMGGQGAEKMTGDVAGRSTALVVSARHVVAEALASLVRSHTAMPARTATADGGLDQPASLVVLETGTDRDGALALAAEV